MTILGIDYGRTNIGLAISGGIFVQPYNKIKNQSLDFVYPEKNRRVQDKKSKIKNTNQKLKIIKDTIRKEKVSKVVIGISEGQIAEEIKEFGEALKKTTGVTVEYYDETLSSQEAVKKMIEMGRKRKFRKEKGHNIAACIILQNYLDNAKLRETA